MRTTISKNQILRNLYADYITWRSHQELEIGKRLWNTQTIRSYEETQHILAELISSGQPFFAGKIGANEQNILHWGSNIKIPTFPFGNRTINFEQTKNCASNAGIVPRDYESYRNFYHLLSSSLREIDALGIWFNPGEYYLVHQFCDIQTVKKCFFFDLEPFFSRQSWSRCLENKNVYLISPFLDSCLEQYSKREKIWKNPNILPEFTLQGYKFPYLFSADSCKSWQDVFEEIKAELNRAVFDVAIIGCGGLSLPIAAYCKQIGKQAIHLGGAAQLLFGIRASRYEADPKYRSLMNENWVRAKDHERPPEYKKIENGCYW